MKRISVKFTPIEGEPAVTEAFMFDRTTILQLDGAEWAWLTFTRPVELTPTDVLELDENSQYAVLAMPAVAIDPAELESLSAIDYVRLIAKAMADAAGEE